MSKVIIPLANGCEEIEAVSIVDVLRRGGVEVIMASVSDNLHVQGTNGIGLTCDVTFSSQMKESYDMIILPGGCDGVSVLTLDKNVQSKLQEMDSDNKPIGAMCAAPIALKSAGVLKENFTCYPGAEERIHLEGFQSDKHMVVQEKNVITSRGPGTSICFALEIVKQLEGEETFNALKYGLLANYCEDAKVFT